MLTDACTGVPIFILQEMVRGKTGIRRKHNWLPTDGQVLEWIEEYGRRFKVTSGEPLHFKTEKFYDRNGVEIPGKKFEEPTTPEEKRMHADRLTSLARRIRETTKATQRANSKLAPTTIERKYTKGQRDAMLLKSLDDMEAAKPNSMRGGDDEPVLTDLA